MDYDLGRDHAIRNAYLGIISEFLLRYRRGRPTVVLLPGGMGSQLNRSPEPYRGEAPNFAGYEPVWIDLGILFSGDGLTLEIDPQGRDLDGHIIVPNGELRFLVDAYDGTRRWARASGFNYVVFGYDWRRPIEEGARYLRFFLSNIRMAVLRKHNEDPLPSTTLLAHSQGGLVTQMFLNLVGNPLPWFARAITVATPFYGTWSHMDRFFVGQSPLSEIHGRRRVAEIAGTLPGPYALMFIDRQTFDRDWEALGFNSAADYPMTDAATNNPIDCYDPANYGRWPGWVNTDHIDRARLIRQTIARPLAEPVTSRIFNIRSRLDDETPTRQSWAPVPADFDPDSGAGSPVGTTSREGGGDGTVPGWSAWHAYTPPDNRLKCEIASSHMDMMEHEEVLNMVGPLIDPAYTPVAATAADGRYGDNGDRASGEEVRAFAAAAGSGRMAPDAPQLYEERIWRGMMREARC